VKDLTSFVVKSVAEIRQVLEVGNKNRTVVGLHSLPGGVRLVTCATRTRLMGCTHSRGVSDWLQYAVPDCCFGCHSRVSDWLHGPHTGCYTEHTGCHVANWCVCRPYALLGLSLPGGVRFGHVYHTDCQQMVF
jgi:hypothetical protein